MSNYENHKQCENGHPSRCEDIGELTKTGIKKELCCLCYWYSSIKRVFYPDFTFDDFCDVCV
jgi:hypothetical protein